MAIKLEKYSSIEVANHLLVGGLIGRAVPLASRGVLLPGLVGNALTLTSPAGSHTFTQPSDAPAGLMRFKDLKAQLETAFTPNLTVLLVDGKIAFKHNSAGTVVSMGAVDEAARTALGFKTNAAISGRFVAAPGGSAPAFIGFLYAEGNVYISLEV